MINYHLLVHRSSRFSLWLGDLRFSTILPLALLGGTLGPLGVTRGSPVLASSTVPARASGSGSASVGTSKTSSGSIPVTGGSLEAGLDGSGGLGLSGGLLLLSLVLSLGLRVAVY